MKVITVDVDMKKIYDYFLEAEEELKNRNRFLNEKLDRIVEYLISFEVNRIYLRRGTFLYRARIYEEVDGALKYQDKSNTKFKGYDEINSYVNLNHNNVGDGRFNPFGITYLYVADSQKCCVHEIRPNIGSYVSVASIEVCERLKILDLSTDTIWLAKRDEKKESIIPGIENGFMCLYLHELFKRPYQYKFDYLVTQYIAEKIKNNGFDGIKYTSSLYKGEENKNYVIFSYNKCHAVDSKLYRVIENHVIYE